MLSAEDFHRLGFTPRACFPPVSSSDIERAEAELGFQLPPLLKRLYSDVSNGIAGFAAYEIIGLKGGYRCHCGDLVETYRTVEKGQEWKTGLLPICHWGCNSFSCVDCNDPRHAMFTYEAEDVWSENYTLEEFFEMWLNGHVSFSQEGVEIQEREMINPFTRKKQTISVRIRKRKSPSQ
jgi:hypothetical protein